MRKKLKISHNSYTTISGDPDNLVLAAPNKISPDHIKFISEDEKPALNVMKSMISLQNPMMIAHVRICQKFIPYSPSIF